LNATNCSHHLKNSIAPYSILSLSSTLRLHSRQFRRRARGHDADRSDARQQYRVVRRTAAAGRLVLRVGAAKTLRTLYCVICWLFLSLRAFCHADCLGDLTFAMQIVVCPIRVCLFPHKSQSKIHARFDTKHTRICSYTQSLLAILCIFMIGSLVFPGQLDERRSCDRRRHCARRVAARGTHWPDERNSSFETQE
jgi:hypothetical protein